MGEIEAFPGDFDDNFIEGLRLILILQKEKEETSSGKNLVVLERRQITEIALSYLL